MLACHAGGPGSIPGRRSFITSYVYLNLNKNKSAEYLCFKLCHTSVWSDYFQPANVRVNTIDKEYDFAVPSNITGRQLFDKVIAELAITELWFFGLQFIDTKGNKTWLKLKKKVSSVQSRDKRKGTISQLKESKKTWSQATQLYYETQNTST